ncbi:MULTISPECIES: AraC family transcriptional regulator [Paenibacillus]|uniref:AraC family transcriptional regulator n=1 Tax=Paenibacillus TaxID=44249 RepID=UPI00048E79EC|nr:AraC family transcriptional regulator [Paenibacillus sp. IHBB 10380]
MQIDQLSFIPAFKRANSVLNRSVSHAKCPELCTIIHYWGFMPRHFDNTEHKHSFFEACYVLAGTGSYLEDSTEFPLRPGTLFLSRPGIQHQIKSRDGLSLCYVAFEPDDNSSSESYLSAFRQLAKQGKPVLQEAADQTPGLLWLSMLSLFKPASTGIQEAPPGLNGMAMSLILSILSAHGSGIHAASSPQETGDEGHSMFRQAEWFIKDNLNEPLSLERIAGHLHITTRHLTRLFRKYGHQSFVHYVQEQRVQKAKHMLLNTDRQIKEVAELCGFDSVHYFTRVFTSKLGVTPARFRRSQFTEGRYDSDM